MSNVAKSIKKSINEQLVKLEAEEKRLNEYYEGRMRVADDSCYAGIARNIARNEAKNAQQKLDNIIDRKIELLKELQAL